MSNLNKSGMFASGRIAWITGIACIACCAVPILGVAVGSAAIAGFAMYSEKAALAIGVAGVFILIYLRLIRSKAPTCEINGNCRPKNIGSE